MYNSLRLKIILPLVFLTSSIAILGSVIVYNYFSESLVHELQLRTESLADAVRRSIEITTNNQYMQRIINAYGDSEGLELIILTTGEPAKVIASTKHRYIAASTDEVRKYIASSEIDFVQKSKKSIFKYLPQHEVYIATIPIQLRPPPGDLLPIPAVLSLYINSIETRNKVLRSGLIWVIALVSLLAMMAATTYALLKKMIISPLTYLRNITKLRAAGNSALRANVTSDDELGELSSDINSMLNRIQQEENRKIEIMQKLSDSEERLSLALSATTDGLWDVNIENNEMLVNKNWYTMLDYDEPGEFTSLDHWFDSVHDNDKNRLMSAWQDHINNSNERLEIEYRIKTRHGDWLWVQARGKVVGKNSRGNPERIVGTQTDISERKRMDIIKSQFISVVSHELRTPLTSIKGSLGLIQGMHSQNLDAQTLALIDLADRNSQRLIDLVNDILDLSKLESDEFTYDLKLINLVDVVKDCVHINEGYGVGFEVKLVFETELAQCYIEGDKKRLSQAISNLISNAIKYSKKQSIVKIKIKQHDTLIRIAVQDYGAGIPLNAQENIFDNFVQADSSDTRQAGGTGLGLGISKHIVEYHNGNISFVSAPGEGTSFYIDLPGKTTSV